MSVFEDLEFATDGRCDRRGVVLAQSLKRAIDWLHMAEGRHTLACGPGRTAEAELRSWVALSKARQNYDALLASCSRHGLHNLRRDAERRRAELRGVAHHG